MRDAFCVADGGVGLATDVVILSLLALSAWLVLRTGRISLGQQAFFGIGAYAAGIATTLAHWPLAPALAAGMALGAVASAGVALSTARLGGLHYAVAPLAFAELTRLGLLSWRLRVREPDGSWIGPDGVDGFRDIRWLLENQVTPERFLAMGLAVLAVVLVGLLWLGRTRAGAAMAAVGHDDGLAAASGLPVLRLRVAAAALAGALAALGGGLHAHRLTFVDPNAYDPMLGVHAVGYALIGGLATPIGPLLGAAFDMFLLETSKLFGGWRMVVFGGLVAVFLRVRPRGLLDEAFVHRLAAAWRRAFPTPSSRTTHAHP